MNPTLAELLIQVAATIVGGIVLFLIGLIYSALSKRVKEYTNWLSKNWRLIAAFGLLIYVIYDIYEITDSIPLALLPIDFAAAIMFITAQVSLHNQDRIERVFRQHSEMMAVLRSDILMEGIHYWEIQEVQENVLDSCFEVVSSAPTDYHGLAEILRTIEKTLGQMIDRNLSISTFTLGRVHEVLGHMPVTATPQIQRIEKLLTAIHVRAM